MSNRVLFHIGTEKTGTTSIQRFLEMNERSIENQGFYYSQAAGRRQNWKLPFLAYCSPAHSDLGGIIPEIEHIDTQRQHLITSLTKELAKAHNGTLIFSSELVHSRLPTPLHVERFAEALSVVGITSPKFLIYIREPGETANSLYSTALRAGSKAPMPPRPGQDPYFDNICNHKATVQRWSAVFGQKSLEVRLFRGDRLNRSSIIHDFCGVLGIHTAELQLPEHANKSLSHLEAQLLWRLNNSIPIHTNGVRNPLYGNLATFFDNSCNLPTYSMPNELWYKYKSYYAESNEWIREKLFPNEAELFITDKEQPEMKQDIKTMSSNTILDSFVHLLVRIWINKQSQLIRHTDSDS